MQTVWKQLGGLVVSLVMLAGPGVAIADGPKVLNVISVKVSGDPAAYLVQLKELNAAVARLGSTVRTWQATEAGAATGMIYSVIEHADLATFAQFDAKLRADADFQRIRKELNASGMREITGSSLLIEVTP